MRYRSSVRPIAAALVALGGALAPPAAVAFRDFAIGTVVPSRPMRTSDGRRVPLVVDGKVSVFVFVRADHEHSRSALAQLGELERELGTKPVRMVAVVSDTDAPEAVRRLVAEAGARMPVLVDEGDALYGELGVALHPSVGIADRERRLVGYQPFRKVNFLDAMRGQVRLALGEIDQAALARILDPGAAPPPSGAGRARARLKLARALLAGGSVDAAIESARAAVALDPALSDAHLALAEALARRGACEEAAREGEEARRLSGGAPVALVACARR
jgi:hypothetical protein